MADGQLSQLPVEALRAVDTTAIPLQLSQLAVEVLHASVAAPTLAQLSQLPVEVLRAVAAAAGERVTTFVWLPV